MKDFLCTCIGPWCRDADGRTARAMGPLHGVPEGWGGTTLLPRCPLCHEIGEDLLRFSEWLMRRSYGRPGVVLIEGREIDIRDLRRDSKYDSVFIGHSRSS